MENPFAVINDKLDMVLTEIAVLKSKQQEPVIPTPPPTEPVKRLLKVREAAERLGVCQSTVRAYIRKGELGAIKSKRGINGSVRIETTEIERFIESMKQKKV